jgi:hypothetical protein
MKNLILLCATALILSACKHETGKTEQKKDNKLDKQLSEILPLSTTKSHVAGEKMLGNKKGLGSDSFVLADTSFKFPDDLKVEGKIYYNEYAKRYGLKDLPKEKFFRIKKVQYATDKSLQGMTIRAMKISPDTADYWHTMYGGAGVLLTHHEAKELGGSGKADGYYYITIELTEQPLFSFRVQYSQKERLKKEFQKMLAVQGGRITI